jgi:hypothetical protein
MDNDLQLRQEPPAPDRRTVTAATGVLLFAFLLGAQGCGGTSGSGLPPPAVPTYTTIDAPGAGTATGLGTFVQDINAEGDIVGFFKKTPFDLGHVFVRSAAGALTVLDVPGQGTQNGQGAVAQRINSAGTIVGYFADSQSVFHGFIRTLDGNFTIFDVPGAIATYTAGINDAGTVAGQFVDNNLAIRGFIRGQDGIFTVFDVPYVFILTVVDIDAGGAVIGSFADISSVYHGFLRNPDGTSDIFDAPGIGIGCDPNTGTGCAMGTGVGDINGSGAIVGTDYATIGPQSFVRTPAGVFTLFSPPGTDRAGSSATGINDSGVIVGNYTDANNETHGYLRNPNGALTTIDDPNAFQGANSPGTFVTHINVTGAIVGYYFDAQGAGHGFVRQ